jgi:hypothetical protein
MSKQQEDNFLVGYLAGGVAAVVGLILQATRSEMIPAFKASKEFKEKLTRVAKARGWTLNQATYVAASVGVEMMLKEDAEREQKIQQVKK